MSHSGAGLPSLAEQVVSRLKAEGAWLCAVESCTGGLISSSLTDVSGSSAILWAALTTYENSAKERLVGVPSQTLERHGAVSEETARAMAEGGLARMARDHSRRMEISPLYSVATTGIAGPGGATEGKPVGICYVAVSFADPASGSGGMKTRVKRVETPAGTSRAENKRLFAEAALRLLLERPATTALA